MEEDILRVRKSFDQRVTSVSELLEFDRIILDVSIKIVADLNVKLKNLHNINSPYLLAENALTALRSIREHDSLRTRYRRMFNQCLILLVSHFGSSVRDLFESSVDKAVTKGTFEDINRFKVEITLEDLRNSPTSKLSMGYLLASQEKTSFQDMQSISRSFKKFFGIDIPRTADVNNIILGQACRNAIVHAGANVDAQMLKQLQSVNPRSVKPHLELDSEILFEPDEVENVSKSMIVYIDSLCSLISNRLHET